MTPNAIEAVKAPESTPFPAVVYVSGSPTRKFNDSEDLTLHGERVDENDMGDLDEVAEYHLVKQGKVKIKTEVVFL